MEKDVYFESEPIYLLWDLENDGSDTAWISGPELAYGNLVVTILQDGSRQVPTQGVIADLIVGPGWRGFPLPPGGHDFQMTVLQDFWGDDPPKGSRLFHRRLSPGRYELRVHFDSHNGLSLVPARIDAPPISFVVRSRSPSEDELVRQVESIRAMPWNAAQRGQSVHALLNWVENQASKSPQDPFIAFLMSEGLITPAAVGVSPEPADSARLKRLQVTIAQTIASSPAAAVVVGVIGDDTLQLKRVLSHADGEIVTAVASYRLKRARSRLHGRLR